MSSPNINSWYYVKLTLKSKEDGTTTKTLRLSNRPLVDEADGATVYYPILKSISNIGSEAGDTIPIAVSGSIVIDDSPGTIGLDRKFSDLTERWQLIGGVVNIYSANTTADDIAITADFNLDWTTEIVRARKNGDQFEINVSERGLSQNTMTRAVTASGMNGLYSTTTVPSSSIGHVLPLSFGSNVVIAPIVIQEANNVYAYSTNLGANFVNGGVQTYYLPNEDDVYGTVLNGSGLAGTGDFNNSNAYVSDVRLDQYEVAMYLQGASTNNYLITRIDVEFKGFNFAYTFAGKITLNVYAAVGNSTTLAPNSQVLATGQVNAVDYQTSFQGASAFYIPFSLNRALPLNGTNGYWISLQHTQSSTGTNVAYARYSSATAPGTGYYTFIKDKGNWSYEVGDITYGLVGYIFRFKCYGVKFTDRPQGYTTDIDSQGFGYSYFDCQHAPWVTGYAVPPLSALPWIVAINGIKDDGSGAITGTPSTVIKEPYHILKVLDYKYNGTNWTSTGQQLDFTAFSSTLVAAATATYPRQIKGFVSERAPVADIMTVVCANSAFKIVRYNGASKSFTVYGWGYRQATQAVITDEDAKVLGIEYLGTETIVNIADINYDRSLLNFNPIQNFDNTSIYNYSSKYTKATAGPFSSLSTVSDLLFSKRELNNTGFDLLSPDSATYIDSMAQYFMGVYAYPHVYVTIEVPLFKYRTLDLLQVVDILHPSLPAYFGSNPDAADPYYAAGGAANDILDGEYLKQAQRYRAQIESKTLNYNLGDFPTMILKCRLLINPADPT